MSSCASWPESRRSPRSSSRATPTSRRSRGSTCSPATTTRSPRGWTPAAPAAILTCSPFAGKEMRRIVDEPDSRATIQAELKELIDAFTITQLSMTVKAGLKLIGQEVGGVRLPLVECNDDEVAVLRGVLERRGLLSAV